MYNEQNYTLSVFGKKYSDLELNLLALVFKI